MVRFIKYTLAFFRLIRITNLLIIAATMYLLRWFIFIPVLKNHHLTPQVSEILFFFLVLSTLCIAAGGYVINDYFDRKADLINRPGRVILGRILRRRAGIVWHTILTVTGVLLGTFVSYKLGNLKFSFIFFIISGLLWFYSTTYKRQVLLGNLVVAFLVACVPLIVLLFEIPMFFKDISDIIKVYTGDVKFMSIWIGGYSLFAFLLTLIREITKDLEDYEGDFAFGRQTIPIAWGPRTAKIFIIAIGIITNLLLILVVYKFRSSIITILYSILLIFMPLILQMILVYKAKSKKEYTIASKIIKLVMLSGLIYIVIAANWIFSE